VLSSSLLVPLSPPFSPVTSILRFAAALLLASTLLPAQQSPQGKPPAAEPVPKIPPLGQAATETLAHSFGEAEHWAMRAIVALSLGSDWHPAGVPVVLQCLRDKDERLVPYGVEVLRGMDDESLQQVATAELVGELIEKQLRRKNVLFQGRLLEVLHRMLPGAAAKDRAGFEAWWRDAKPTWVPPAWQAPPADRSGGTVAGGVVQRAFDLRDAGLDVAIVIDSTGSMQVAIDTARDALDDVVALLAGIAPKLRLGLVHYKDFEDMNDGARLLVPMTKVQQDVRDKLAKLVASGGGDVPERIESGLAVALGKEMGWNKDANRLILVIGDAPPHADVEQQLYEMVKNARERPFEVAKGPVTGAPAKKAVRPFITSTIATNPAPKEQFERIAAAGGGTCVVLQGVPGPGARGKGPAPAPAKGPSGVQQLVEHIMLLSFGAEHRPQLQRFVRTFFEYRDAGFFK